MKIKKIERRRREPTDHVKEELSISYKNNQDLEKYNSKNYYSDEGIYDSTREYIFRDLQYRDIFTKKINIFPYNKKKYGPIYPIKLEYYMSGGIKTIETYLIFNKQHTKTYKHFYENGRLKKYVSCIGTDISDQLDKFDLLEEDDAEIPFINSGGDYIEFYDNGYKRCEGSIEYIFPHGRGKPLTISGPRYSAIDIEDMDERFPDTSDYKEERNYYRCNLWIFYNENGDIFKTMDYSNGNTGNIKLFEGQGGGGYNLSSDIFITWIDGEVYYPAR